MDPRTLRSLSYTGVTLVMVISLYYFYTSWVKGEPKWNFMILGFGIAILLTINLLTKKRD